MTDDEKLMKQALEALELAHPRFGVGTVMYANAINALRDRLAQPEQKPEPPPWWTLTKDEIRDGARKTDPGGEDLCSWSFECGVRFAELALGIKEKPKCCTSTNTKMGP